MSVDPTPARPRGRAVFAKETMPLHTAMIDGVQVPGFRYIVHGRTRGLVSTHRTKRAALRSLAKDARERMRTGQPSDAQVHRWRDGWVPLEDDEKNP